jgi:CRISPR-associated protein Csm2
MSGIKLWQDKEKSIINPVLFSEEAEKLARAIGQEGKDARGNLNKGTQLRRFFDEIVHLRDQSRGIDNTASERWGNLLPYVKMMIAKATYAEGRRLVSPNFVEMLKSGIGQIETPRDLRIFADFFEAFMGFYKLHGPN